MSEYKDECRTGSKVNVNADAINGSLGEAITRHAMCELFPEKAFHKTRRPVWLNKLELDGYNEELRLAFEYHGVQHFKYTPFFHRNGEIDLEKQKERDARKEWQCIVNMVSLIAVTYETSLQDIRAEVRKQVEDCGYLQELGRKHISDRDFLKEAIIENRHQKAMLEKAQRIAKEKGGECLSDRYYDYQTPLLFRCGEGHLFWASLASIDQPATRGIRFCRECGGTARKEDEKIKEGVESCGYTFVSLIESPIITGRPRRKMKVKCPVDHAYDVLLDNFFPINEGKPRRECVTCARLRTNGEKGQIERDKSLASYGLEALSPYGNRHVKASWRCIKAGHVFEASWNTIALRKHAKCLECGKG